MTLHGPQMNTALEGKLIQNPQRKGRGLEIIRFGASYLWRRSISMHRSSWGYRGTAWWWPASTSWGSWPASRASRRRASWRASTGNTSRRRPSPDGWKWIWSEMVEMPLQSGTNVIWPRNWAELSNSWQLKIAMHRSKHSLFKDKLWLQGIQTFLRLVSFIAV